MPKINEEAAQLRQFIDKLNGHMNALEIMGENPKCRGSLFTHLITTKLDINTTKSWETVSPKEEIPSVLTVLTILTIYC